MPRRVLAAFAGLLAAQFLLAGRPADSAAAEGDARPAKQVLFILDRAADPFADRLRAEIEGMGLKIVVLQAWREPERPEQMETAAREQRAAAAIRLVPSRRGVEIWMADETSGRSLLRQLIVDESPEGPDENLVAMQLVELLRTSLLVDPHPAASSAPSAAPQPALPPELIGSRGEPCTWCARVQTGAGFLASPGGAGAALEMWLSLQMVGHRMGVALDLAAPIRGMKPSGPEGSASLRPSLAALVLLRRWGAPESRLSLTAGLGGGILHIGVEGKATPPLVTAFPDSTTMGIGYARFDTGLAFTRWLRLTLRLAAGASFGRLVVRFAGNEAATWGYPFGAGSLLLDAGW